MLIIIEHYSINWASFTQLFIA
jgi:hypothetical protein